MTIGFACLVIGFLLSLFAVASGVYAGSTGDPRWAASARRAIYALAGLMAVAFVVLEAAYARSDFSFSLVANNSSEATPAFYKLTALWSSQAGSLLLWVSVLAVFSALVLRSTRNEHQQIAPWANAVLGGVAAFFLGLMLLIGEANPFLASSPVPLDGQGLNPLLRHPSMMFHPPMLYAGYVGFSIPFAYAVGALITRRVDAGWIRSTRHFTLLAWTFLSIGVMLGARWSYSELGWGGYWAWDPVENASLMPWLVGTAFLHSVMVQEKRGMLRVWNISLIIATFSLALLGTFLVRSGILDSIHAFGASSLGTPFLIFILAVLAGSVALVISRLDSLRSERRIDSLLSREAMFMLNNFLLVALATTVFWGTFFPLISEAVTGDKASVGPPWFNSYITPIAIGLVLVAGIGPLVPWRRMSPSRLPRLLAVPVLIALSVLVLALALGSGDNLSATLTFTFGTFSIAVVMSELVRALRARRAAAGGSLPGVLGRMIGANRRRYGGYTVHVGIAVIFFGIAGSSAFDKVQERKLAVGESISVGDYKLTYDNPTAVLSEEKQTFGASLSVTRNGKPYTTLRPSRNYYPASSISEQGPIARYFEGEATSEVAMRAGVQHDLWTAIEPDLTFLRADIAKAGKLPKADDPRIQGYLLQALAQGYRNREPAATFRVAVNPMVSWIWAGGVIALCGAALGLWPGALRRRRRSPRAAEAARIAKGANDA